jgi:hypothetical protein
MMSGVGGVIRKVKLPITSQEAEDREAREIGLRGE